MNNHLLDDITALNNELVNTQRTLFKQNAEITRLNNALALTNTELEQFTYVASHDLKEPLRMITGFMRLLRNKYSNVLDLKAISYIDMALDGGKRMQALITDLLELSHSGAEEGKKVIVDLNDILEQVKLDISPLVEETNAEIISLKALPLLEVYEIGVRRLFQNLISNAIKFRRSGIPARIIIDVSEKEDCWLFSINDNGIGMEAGNPEKIFEFFSRLNPAEEYEGAGLGLAICKKIVARHGGTIWVESLPGEGSTFYFTLLKDS